MTVFTLTQSLEQTQSHPHAPAHGFYVDTKQLNAGGKVIRWILPSSCSPAIAHTLLNSICQCWTWNAVLFLCLLIHFCRLTNIYLKKRGGNLNLRCWQETPALRWNAKHLLRWWVEQHSRDLAKCLPYIASDMRIANITESHKQQKVNKSTSYFLLLFNASCRRL